MNEDITIDLKDLLYRVLLRWRIILIFCILGTLLANGYGIYKDIKAKKAAESVNTQEERGSLTGGTWFPPCRRCGRIPPAWCSARCTTGTGTSDTW